jgi:hypothetical protein
MMFLKNILPVETRDEEKPVCFRFNNHVGCGLCIGHTNQCACQSTPAPNGEIRVPAVNIQLNAPGQNPMVNTTDSSGKTAGILLGIWHGIISPVTMVMSFVNENVQMYEVHNDGSQYNLGFLLGTGIIFLILGGLIGSRR